MWRPQRSKVLEPSRAARGSLPAAAPAAAGDPTRVARPWAPWPWRPPASPLGPGMRPRPRPRRGECVLVRPGCTGRRAKAHGWGASLWMRGSRLSRRRLGSATRGPSRRRGTSCSLATSGGAATATGPQPTRPAKAKQTAAVLGPRRRGVKPSPRPEGSSTSRWLPTPGTLPRPGASPSSRSPAWGRAPSRRTGQRPWRMQTKPPRRKPKPGAPFQHPFQAASSPARKPPPLQPYPQCRPQCRPRRRRRRRRICWWTWAGAAPEWEPLPSTARDAPPSSPPAWKPPRLPAPRQGPRQVILRAL
mmetsp:Transcript_44153/g.99771  ORF Transcript_44153/g.99771 Transcript_44153/m.99771 type:complete len:303 (+) Transcript_44153:192-1100(+)